MEFKRVPQKYWDNDSFQKEFLDEFAKKMNIKSVEDWSFVSHKLLKEHGGSGLLKRYQYNLFKALQSVYPDKEWNLFSSISRLPRGFWDSTENHRLFLDNFAAIHNINSVEDWSSVSTDDIKAAGGTCILEKYSSFFDCLNSGMKKLNN